MATKGKFSPSVAAKFLWLNKTKYLQKLEKAIASCSVYIKINTNLAVEDASVLNNICSLKKKINEKQTQTVMDQCGCI